jgi:hypothetical protein
MRGRTRSAKAVLRCLPIGIQRRSGVGRDHRAMYHSGPPIYRQGMSVRSKLSAPLQIVFRPWTPAASVDQAAPSDEQALKSRPVPYVELTVYSGDSLACGQLALAADRVTDLMNDHEAFEFLDTSLVSLEDGHQLVVQDIVIARDEIFAVAVTGPRGDPVRRTRTRPIPVELHLGRYDVNGNIHVVPGSDPIASFRRRKVMVPLTEATIEYDSPTGRLQSRYQTILVNRLLADWIATASRADVRPPELVQERQGRGLARDFTPELRVR